MSKTMAELNCVLLKMRFDFDEKIFDTRRFRKSANLEPKLPINVSVASNSGLPGRNEHTHFSLDVDGSDSFLTISYHPTRADFDTPDDATNNTTEARIKELSEVFKTQTLTSSTVSRFVFSKRFSPLMFLGYPVGIDNEAVNGAVVSGQQITIGKGASLIKVFVTLEGNGRPSVLVTSKKRVNLASFRPETLISKDAVIANALVKESSYVDSNSQ